MQKLNFLKVKSLFLFGTEESLFKAKQN